MMPDYDTYRLEITTLAEPNFFREPVVFIDSPEITDAFFSYIACFILRIFASVRIHLHKEEGVNGNQYITS